MRILARGQINSASSAYVGVVAGAATQFFDGVRAFFEAVIFACLGNILFYYVVACNVARRAVYGIVVLKELVVFGD